MSVQVHNTKTLIYRQIFLTENLLSYWFIDKKIEFYLLLKTIKKKYDKLFFFAWLILPYASVLQQLRNHSRGIFFPPIVAE